MNRAANATTVRCPRHRFLYRPMDGCRFCAAERELAERRRQDAQRTPEERRRLAAECSAIFGSDGDGAA